MMFLLMIVLIKNDVVIGDNIDMRINDVVIDDNVTWDDVDDDNVIEMRWCWCWEWHWDGMMLM